MSWTKTVMFTLTFEGDESINLPHKQIIIRPEKLQLPRRHTTLTTTRRGDHGHIMTGIRIHDLTCSHRPINPLHLASTGVFDHHRSHLSRLTIPHRSEKSRVEKQRVFFCSSFFLCLLNRGKNRGCEQYWHVARWENDFVMLFCVYIERDNSKLVRCSFIY